MLKHIQSSSSVHCDSGFPCCTRLQDCHLHVHPQGFIYKIWGMKDFHHRLQFNKSLFARAKCKNAHEKKHGDENIHTTFNSNNDNNNNNNINNNNGGDQYSGLTTISTARFTLAMYK